MPILEVQCSAHRPLYYLHIGPVEHGASGSELVKVGCVDFWRAVNCFYCNVDFFSAEEI